MFIDIYQDKKVIVNALMKCLMRIASQDNVDVYNRLNEFVENFGVSISDTDVILESAICNEIKNITESQQDVLYSSKDKRKYIMSEESCLPICEGVSDAKEVSNIYSKNEVMDLCTRSESDKIGEGGFSDVYRIHNKVDNKNYALKKIKIDDSGYNSVLKEVRLFSGLEHPNITKYVTSWIEYEKECDLLNIQMELCHMTLKEYLVLRTRYNNYDIKRTYGLIYDMLNGISFLHENNIIHGDLSPYNIFIKFSKSKRPMAKIGDFGLSHKICSESMVNEHGFIKLTNYYGNPVYMAPEVENKYICKASDIYSYGIINLEMLNKFKTQHESRKCLRFLKTRKLKPKNCKFITNIPTSIATQYIAILYKITHLIPHKRPDIKRIRDVFFDFFVNIL